MPIFRFNAVNRKGKEEKGIIDAPGMASARKVLKSKGLFVRTITEDTEKKDRELFPALSAILYRVSRRDVSLFARQLGTLLDAGLPLDRSLNNIVDQTENPYLKKALVEIRSDVIEGESLSLALKKHPDIFPPVYHNLISIGEQTGAYEKALIRLADLEDRNLAIKNKVFTALSYPLFMIFLMSGIVVFLLGVVLPQLEELFLQMDQELPWITRFVLGLSGIITSYKIFFPIGIIGGGFFLFRDYISKPEGRLKYEKFMLGLPLIGNFLRKLLLARFSRNLGVMLNSNVPLITALHVVAGVVGHTIFKSEIDTAVERIKEGSKISDAFQDSIVLSQMMLGMISAGEMSDSIPVMVEKIADITESDMDATIQKLTGLLEPLMMVLMGGLIIMVMMAMLLPMSDLTNRM